MEVTNWSSSALPLPPSLPPSLPPPDRTHRRAESGSSRRSHRSRSRSPSSSRSSRPGGGSSRGGALPPRDRSLDRQERDERSKEQRELDELTKDQRTVFISQLTMKVDERVVRRFFENFGKVRSVVMLRDRATGKHKGRYA